MSDIYSDEFASGRAAAPLTISPALSRAAAAGLFLMLVIGLAVWAYRLGTRDAGEVPIIRAMEGPARVQPAEPGGEVAAHQGLEVNSVLAGTPESRPAELPEVRIVAPAVGLADEDGPQGELRIASPRIPVFPMPETDDLRMPAAEDSANAFAEVEGAEDAVAALIEAALRTDADAGAETKQAAAGPRPLGRPSGLAARRPAAERALASAPQPSATPAPELQQAAFTPASPAPSAPSPAVSVAAAREVASVAPGSRLVQLGAFDSEGLARQVWGQLAARHGDLLGSKSLFLERATHNARVFYRLRLAGFASSDETRILCESLRTRGVDCIPVTLN